jgi:23S rRNA (adenine2503-C2)-methyltransferase
MKAGYASPVRTPRGEDILAACGQLKTTSERLRKSQISAKNAAKDSLKDEITISASDK